MIKYGGVQFCEGGTTPLAHIDPYRWSHTQEGESKSGGTPDFILQISNFLPASSHYYYHVCLYVKCLGGNPLIKFAFKFH